MQRMPGLFDEIKTPLEVMIQNRSLLKELTEKSSQDRLNWLLTLNTYFRSVWSSIAPQELCGVLDLLKDNERIPFLNSLPSTYLAVCLFGSNVVNGHNGLCGITLTSFRAVLLRLESAISDRINPVIQTCLNQSTSFQKALTSNLAACHEPSFAWLRRSLMPDYLPYEFEPDNIKSLADLVTCLKDSARLSALNLLGTARLKKLIATENDLKELYALERTRRISKLCLQAILELLTVEYLQTLTTNYRELFEKSGSCSAVLNQVSVEKLANSVKSIGDLLFYAQHTDRLKAIVKEHFTINALCALPWSAKSENNILLASKVLKLLYCFENIEDRVTFFKMVIVPNITHFSSERDLQTLIGAIPKEEHETILSLLPNEYLVSLGWHTIKKLSETTLLRIAAMTKPTDFSLNGREIEYFFAELPIDFCHAWVRKADFAALINAVWYPINVSRLYNTGVEFALKYFPKDMVLSILFNKHTHYEYRDEKSEQYLAGSLQLIPADLQAEFLDKFNVTVLQRTPRFQEINGNTTDPVLRVKRGMSLLAENPYFDSLVLAIHDPKLRIKFVMDAIDAGFTTEKLNPTQINTIKLGLGNEAAMVFENALEKAPSAIRQMRN